MLLTGLADEAASDLDGQLHATRLLGWRSFEARAIDGQNIHDLSDERFDQVCATLQAAGIGIAGFASAIGNWSKDIAGPFAPCLAEARRAAPRMQRLGVGIVRLMSYPVVAGRAPDDQFEGERFKRLRTLVKVFADAGIQAAHENCRNYGGMGWSFTERLLDNVRGLKLLFDTGNPVLSEDFDRPRAADGRRPRQSSWEFYRQAREHIVHVHIKDAVWDEASGTARFTFPGEGQGEVRRILADLLARGYGGRVSIEPHVAVQAHDPSVTATAETKLATYVEYGRRLERMLAAIQGEQAAAQQQQ